MELLNKSIVGTQQLQMSALWLSIPEDKTIHYNSTYHQWANKLAHQLAITGPKLPVGPQNRPLVTEPPSLNSCSHLDGFRVTPVDG